MALFRKNKNQIFFRYLVDFLSRNPLHGLGYLARRDIHCCEFLFWILSILFMIAFGFFCALDLVKTYQSRNSAITLNVDFQSVSTQYPAITLCPHEILDSRKLEDFVSDETFENRLMYKDFLKKLTRINGRQAEPLNLMCTKYHPQLYLQIIFNISRFYNVQILGQSAVKIMTEIGICYTFNNLLYKEVNTSNWLDPYPYPMNEKDRFVSKRSSFNFTDRYPIQIAVKHNISGNVDVYIHSPNEIPTIWSQPAARVADAKKIKLIAAITEITLKGDLLREISIGERRCRHITESNLPMFPFGYSQHLCLMQCRAHYIARFCSCLPHFYMRRRWADAYSYRVCNPDGLNCYAQHLSILRRIDTNSKSTLFRCECLTNCQDQMIVTQASPLRNDTSNASVVLHISYPSMVAYERSVMYSDLDIAVTLFAVMSAFLGLSILSVFDILYFFSIRIYWFRKGYRGSVDNQ